MGTAYTGKSFIKWLYSWLLVCDQMYVHSMLNVEDDDRERLYWLHFKTSHDKHNLSLVEAFLQCKQKKYYYTWQGKLCEM